MLPDFPEIKAECERLLLERAKARKLKEMGVFSSVPETALFEGDKLSTIRDDGSQSGSGFVHAESAYELTREEAEDLTMDQLVAKFDKVGEDLARHQVKHLFKVIDETVEEAGNVCHRQPNESISDVFLRMLERAEIDFDADGKPTWQIVCAPAMAPQFAAAQMEFEASPELQRRHHQAMQKKREEWRDRESNRKLVD